MAGRELQYFGATQADSFWLMLFGFLVFFMQCGFAPLEARTADFVIGSRYLTGEGFQSTAARRLGIRWFTWVLRAACGLRVTDPTSGCWAASRSSSTPV